MLQDWIKKTKYFSSHLKYFLQVALVRVDTAHDAAPEPELGEAEVCVAEAGVLHLLHQLQLVPARQVGGGQGGGHGARCLVI